MIVFIHHSVNPYRVAFFNELSKTKIPFKVYFLSKPAKNRKWKLSNFKLNFEHKFLEGWKFYIPGNDHSYFQVNTSVWKNLKEDNPSTVITIGWNYLAAFIGYFYSKFYKKKFIIWSESTVCEKSLQRTFTLPIIKLVVRNSDRYIAAGARAKEYLELLGADPEKVKIAYYSVDTEKFIKEADKLKKKRLQIRKNLGYQSNDKIILFVGSLIERKGVRNLLELAELLKDKENIKFLLVGFGPLEEEIKAFTNERKLKNIKLAGFVPNEEIMKYFVASDVFILPSLEETWGLVVNEAMCAGKPVLVSKYAGSSEDLVREDENGYIINPNDMKDMKKKLLKILNDNSQIKKFGHESRKIIKKINLKQNVEVIKGIYSKV